MDRKKNKKKQSVKTPEQVPAKPPAKDFSFTYFPFSNSVYTCATLCIILLLPFVLFILEHGNRILGEPRFDNPGFFYFFFKQHLTAGETLTLLSGPRVSCWAFRFWPRDRALCFIPL